MRGVFVCLQPVLDSDHDLMAGWSSGPAGVFSNGTRQPVSGAQMRQVLGQATAAGMQYLMIVTRDGRRIGAVNWRCLSYPGNYQMGAVIGDPRLWNLGYGMDAGIALMGHLFHTLRAHRAELLVGMFNRNMMRVVTKGYMTMEAILTDYFFFDGEYHDAVVCSILRDEYTRLAAAGAFGPRARQRLIPAQEQAEARQVLVDYLAGHGDERLRSAAAGDRRRGCAG